MKRKLLILFALPLLVMVVLSDIRLRTGATVLRVHSARTPDTTSVRRAVDSIKAELHLSIDSIEWSDDSSIVMRVSGVKFLRRDSANAGHCVRDTAVDSVLKRAAARVYAPNVDAGSTKHVMIMADYRTEPLSKLFGRRPCRGASVSLYRASQLDSVLSASM